MSTLCVDRSSASASARTRAALRIVSLRFHLALHRAQLERLADALRARGRGLAQRARAFDRRLRESELGALAFFLALILMTFLI